MKNSTLVVMAAGMGSRFGGFKQIEPVGSHGEAIMDYSVFDAIRAGFNKVVFIIKKEIDADFRERIFNRISSKIEAHIVYQDIDDLPEGYAVPEGRTKPWGTTQAVLCVKDIVNEPFSVINADDYYGISAFKDVHDFITTSNDSCMSGYLLKNTVTDAGSVARGVCQTDESGSLREIVELTHIEKQPGGIVYKSGDEFFPLADDSLVSMNFWGFQPDIFNDLKRLFVDFLEKDKSNDNLKSECYLPMCVGELLVENKINVRVLPSKDTWYGFTYKEDKAAVQNAVKELVCQGKYPDGLWL